MFLSTRMMSHPSPNPQKDIALWGPPSSGKSWIIRALNKDLFWYSQHDPEFSYTLEYEGGRSVEISPPTTSNIPPTAGPNDRFLIFTRQGKKDTPSHRLSNFSHHINLHDDAGESLIEAPLFSGKFPITEDTINASPYVIALLDPSLNTNSGLNSPSSLIMYLESVRFLCEALSRPMYGKKFLAICVNKIDRTKIKREPWMCVKSLFGQTMYDLIWSYKSSCASLAIEAFITSSVGQYREGSSMKPNFDPHTGNILYPDRWKPFNVVKPFFWIFEGLEREILGKRSNPPYSQAKYIPYPNPEDFSIY
jgi:GTPase SAR1 family protein